ncbi:MAG TPA: hypothetical protein VHE30_00825 [Polyangiaceae bacterium]|nr:hypothetical protein [Polyangiaceae bacterium]
MRYARLFAVLAVSGLGLCSSACRKEQTYAKSTFYSRRIEPILSESCANSPTQSGCHVAADDRGNAFGNLNVTSYATFTKRKDLLVSYGPYGMPGLLAKVLPGFQIRLSTWDRSDPIVITTDIQHAGGSLIDITSTSFNTLSSWIQRGAAENNSLPPPKDLGRTPCSTAVGADPLFDPTTDPTTPDYDTFATRVNPVIGSTCAAGNCHGSPSNSLYLTCGKTPEQTRWNYFAAGDYVSADAESSELLRRTVSLTAGGVFHEGGTLFQSTADAGYRAILQWATEKGGPDPAHIPQDQGFQFFTRAVQPMLVKRGCMLLGCHAPAMGHDYRLRSGSAGHFGLPATRRNYQLTLDQLALDSSDPNASRILRKNLEPFVAGGAAPQTPLGILHRGGSLFGRGNDACPTDETAFDPATLDQQDPYCVIRHFIEIERADRMATAAPLSAIVYVKRPPRTDAEIPQDFETFAGGADLVRADATLAADGTLTVSTGTSLLAGCGLAAGVDLRRPEVSWDGTQIAFSARASESEPWRIYVIGPSGSCAVEPTIDAASPIGDNGELVHNFDPVFAPDGRIVFASTRGNVMNVTSFDYQGPQRSPADPSRLNANLYVLENGGDAPSIRQLTFLLNQEMTPSFMGDGRLIMTTEKRAKGFYQLAGRRENLDGGDYHPLFGQRATVGFHQVTDIIELADKNFAAILSEPGAAHSAGALAVVNRSLGVDQQSENADDYLQDKNAKDWPNPRFYQHGIRILDGVGKPGESGNVYRNPARLPGGGILVSVASGVPDAGNFTVPFHLAVVNPVTGATTDVLTDTGNDLVWPTAVYARFNRGVYHSKLDEPNGATRVSTDAADAAVSDVTILDAPLLESLLFQNTRSKRVLGSAAPLDVYEDLPPESGVKSFADGGSFVVDDAFGKVYVRRRLIGSATPEKDGSVHLQLPGGVPVVLAPVVSLAGEQSPRQHHQLEEMQFYPGEIVRQGFPRELFNGVCASCHGAVSGYDADISANPDILTQASRVLAKDAAAKKMDQKGPAQGPPFP